MNKEILEALTVLAESTRQQLEQQLALIEVLRGLPGAGAPGTPQKRNRKVKNKSSKRTAPKPEPMTEAQKLIQDVVSLCTDSPLTRKEIVAKTGAGESQVKNALTRLKGDEFPQWAVENLGTERRARWFLRPVK